MDRWSGQRGDGDATGAAVAPGPGTTPAAAATGDETGSRGDPRASTRGRTETAGVSRPPAGWAAIEAGAPRQGGQAARPGLAVRRGALRSLWRAGSQGEVPATGLIAAGAVPPARLAHPFDVARHKDGTLAFSLTVVLAGDPDGPDHRIGRRVGLGAISLELAAAPGAGELLATAELIDGVEVLASGDAWHDRVTLQAPLGREQARDALFCVDGWPSRFVVRARLTTGGTEAIAERRLDLLLADALRAGDRERMVTRLGLVGGLPGAPAAVVASRPARPHVRAA